MLKKTAQPKRETRDEPLKKKKAQKPGQLNSMDNLIHGAPYLSFLVFFLKIGPNEHILSFDLPAG